MEAMKEKRVELKYEEREAMEREWRMKLWNYMLSTLPASVVVNLDAGYFRVRNSSDANIYADDLDKQLYDQFVREWGGMLESRDGGAFFDMFCLKQVMKHRKQGRKRINASVLHVSESRVNALLSVRLLLQRHNNENEMEFQFEEIG